MFGCAAEMRQPFEQRTSNLQTPYLNGRIEPGTLNTN